MEDEIRGARRDMPASRPEHLIAGVMRDRATTQLTVDALGGSGLCSESIFVIHGARGAEALRHRGEGAGFSAGSGAASRNLPGRQTIS